MSAEVKQGQREDGRLWAVPVIFMTAVGLYFVARYEGWWAEGDSAVFTMYIRAFLRDGSLIPTRGEIYPNGYGYQAISLFVVSLTGLDPAALQQLVYPVLAALVALPAWVLYRELTGSARGATIAALLLVIQPEFLFVMLRSSHEKFTRTLMFLCLYLLARSFRTRGGLGFVGALIGLFYLSAFAMVADNNLLAHSFIFAVAVAMAAGWSLERLFPHLRTGAVQLHQRLFHASLVCLGLVWISMFYVYLPSQTDLGVIQSIGGRVNALVLDVSDEATNSYAPVAGAWVGRYTYFVLTAANWVVLLSSLAIWLRWGWDWLRNRKSPTTTGRWVLWLLYAAFALQGALSVVADTSGAIAANFQARVFPSFSMISVAMVGAGLTDWRPVWRGKALRLGLSALAAVLAVLSTLKATDEPGVSNWWMFYRPYELSAVEWADAHLHDSNIWTGFTGRLTVAFTTAGGVSANGNFLTAFAPKLGTGDFVVTDATRLRSTRTGQPLPIDFDSFVVFDDGDAQLYHLRPRTPFQR